MEATYIHTNGRTDKENMAYIHIYITHTTVNHRKENILPFAKTWVDRDSIRLREVSQRKTNTMVSVTWGI